MRKVLVISLCLSIPLISFGQKYVNKKYNFTLNIPSKGWEKPQVISQPNKKLDKVIKSAIMFFNKESRKSILVQILYNKEDMTMANKKYRDNFKSALVKNGSLRIVGEEVVMYAGIPCCKLTLVGSVQGNPAYMRMMALNVSGYQYNITGVSGDTTKTSDPLLEKILKSFSFIKKPIPPKSKK